MNSPFKTLKNYPPEQRAADCKKGKIIHFKGNTYKVTGVDKKGRRFRLEYTNPHMAMGINLWKGHKSVRYADEKRFRRFSEA